MVQAIFTYVECHGKVVECVKFANREYHVTRSRGTAARIFGSHNGQDKVVSTFLKNARDEIKYLHLAFEFCQTYETEVRKKHLLKLIYLTLLWYFDSLFYY